MIEPLALEYVIECEPSHAFATWTEQFGLWWPRGHTVSGSADADVHFEPRVGGRIYERLADGTEIDWGEVTAFDVPRRIAYLWHIRRDRSDATDVEITFTSTDEHATRILIMHSGWERLGAEAEQWRNANTNGWNGLLPHFVAAATQGGT